MTRRDSGQLTVRRMRLLAMVIIFATVSACSAGQAYDTQPPPPEVAEQVPERFYADTTALGPVDDGWITSFDDDVLVTVVNEAMRNNLNLRSAAAQLEAAAASARQAGRRLEPVAALSLGGATGDTPQLQETTWGTSLDVAWEVDLWGRIRAGQSAAQADFQAIQADFEFARQSLAAQTAKAWFLATEAWRQLQIADTTAANLRGILALTEERERVGQATAQDLSLTRADLANAEDAVQATESAYQDARRGLELLVGRYPAAQIEVPTEFAQMPPRVPAGLPSSLLERRPDMVAAERRVAAAFARTDEAQAAKMPTLALTGSVGTASTDLLETLNPANLIWETGAAFVAPLLDQGGREAQVEIATAQQEAAVAAYGAAALTAFSEVESSLANEAFLMERERLLQTAVDENLSAVQAAEVQFDVGVIDQLSLHQIQTRLFSSQSALVRIQSARLTQRVNLHLALGGSFEDTSN